MSIFETHVKDVVQRTDSDPLALVSRFETVDSSASVDATPGQVIVVDDESVGQAVTVSLPENAPRSAKITLKKIGADSSGAGFDVVLDGADSGDGQVVDGDQTLSTQYDVVTVVSDGTDYYVV